MKNAINSVIFVLRLFVATLILSFTIASFIVYFVTSVKFAWFLACCGVVPTVLFISYYYESWKADAL